MSKPVYKYSLDKEFICKYQSTTQAARDFGVDESSVRKAADRNKVSSGYIWTRYRIENTTNEGSIGPNILILDIETAAIRAYVWSLWKQDIYIDQIISNWFMLSWSAKWLGNGEVMSARLTGEEAIKEDDSNIIIPLWNLLEQADMVVCHNGDSFDIPRINSRFIVHGLNPPSTYKQIDTKKIAAKQFGFSSNKLESLARTFGFEGKIHTEFDLWNRCMQGDEKALEEMETYNRQDVVVLEKVYLKLRPYTRSHPNYNLYVESDVPLCSHCGSKHLEEAGYYYFTQTAKYKNYRCLDCGALSRGRKSVLQKGRELVISNG